VHLTVAVAEVPRKHDDLGEHELRDAARVRERRVEDADASAHRVLERDLIGPDAEGANRHEILRGVEHARRDLRLAADAEHLHAGEPRDQLVFLEGGVEQLHVVAIGGELLARDGVDALQKQDFLGHGGRGVQR
jgi:hypothetical protein